MPALVLDLGGVVYRSWPDAAFHARWAAELGCEAESLGERLWGGAEWGLAELGQIGPGDCYARVAARLDVDPGVVEEIAIQAFASNPDEALAEYVVALRRRGVRTAALTNNIQRGATLIARPELHRLFDVVISSAEAGLQKPDPAIYRLAEDRLGSVGPEIVFVDDVEMHVEGALALGWRGVVFRSTDQALTDIATQLAQFGVRAGGC